MRKHVSKLALLVAAMIWSSFTMPPLMAADDWRPAKAPLMTRWAKDVTPANVLPEYPRPQLVRKDWQNLNGLWDYALGDSSGTSAPTSFEGKILVPFPYESALSGIGKASIPDKRLWYRRKFTVPAAWQGRRILLHFGAVSWDSSIFVNGKSVGGHKGSYDEFDFDITESLNPGENELVVSAWNPIRVDVPDAEVVGKQREKSGGIFYTGATGIWQTVWLEPLPAAHITSLKVTPDVDDSSVRVTVETRGPTKGAEVTVTVLDGSTQVATAKGSAGTELRLAIPKAHLWSPEDPHLYDLKISQEQDGKSVDDVTSYCAFRKISLEKDEKGRNRIFFNGKFVFQVGVLDQGYWPDGIYTAPTDAALRFDIEATKKLGYNLSRKHAKVEPARWYYWADKLGVLVWQDMPQMYEKEEKLSAEAKKQFETEWRRIIAQLYNHPSIVVWTTFNEGMGQHDTPRIVNLTKELDPTRLVNNASGWVDKNVGDMHDTHAYPGPNSEQPTNTRSAVNGEFGGIPMSVEGHRWNQDVFGYGALMRSPWHVTKRYQELLKIGYRIRDEKATSALVYTQLTDVEQEINGLLTYDRSVEKADFAIVAAANKGQFPSMPPNPNADLVTTAMDELAEWHFTTEKPGERWMQPDFKDAGWKTGKPVFGHDIALVNTPWTTSDIWIRREFTLPSSIPPKLDFVVLHDEDAEIYVNGTLAATATGFNTGYAPVPMNDAGRRALRPGRNILAVHCRQTTGGQGIDVGIAKARE